MVQRKTVASRFSRASRRSPSGAGANRHRPVAEQHATLSQKLRGHDAYYGITGNSSSVAAVAYVVARIWRKWLLRRRRHGRCRWDASTGLLERFPLPPARVVHSVYRLRSEAVT